MESMRIENHIKKTELLDIDLLTPLQGGLKKLSDENFNKLRQSLIDNGFQFTVHVWEQGGTIYIIDGHQRVHVMKQLRKAGWEIPPINCSFVTASNYSEAKKLILYSVSQYGKIDREGYEEFNMGEDFNMNDYDLPDFYIPLNFDESGLDYSLLEEKTDQEPSDMRDGVKKAIQIEFELEDYEKAFELVKYWRQKGEYVGGMIIETLEAAK